MSGKKEKIGMDEEKKSRIEDILNIELRMFLSVSSHEKASCQDHPEEFKRNRRAQFSTWSTATLSSYFNDLLLAEKDGKNLMTFKYGRMGDLIPCINEDPLIDMIVGVQLVWQKEMFEKYPNVMGGARTLESSGDTPVHTSFATYLRGELETYSHETLRLLYEDVKGYRKNNGNMNHALYAHLVKSYGYRSLEEAETAAE
jgi:hypothetical protein